MARLNPAAGLAAAALLWLAADVCAATTPADLITGPWRIIRGTPGPWASPGEVGAAEVRCLAGQQVVFQPARILGGGALACADVGYEQVELPAQGLFQGGLPEPASEAAAQLGITGLPALSLRVSCDAGAFDYHFAAPDRVLVALDNVVWTLVFQPRSARAAAEAFLRAHFSGDMAFTPAHVTAKARWLTPGLQQAIQGYFALPTRDDEVPVINGDPFTGTQEYPGKFTITQVRTAPRQAQVRVRFDGIRGQVEYLLAHHPEEGWRIDDITGRDGIRLRQLLAP